MALASREAWRLYRGEIPTGMYVCHHCDVTSCVNPAHLFLGTHSQNMRDMLNKGRGGFQKLSLSDAVAIKASPLPVKELERIYGVTKTLIYNIKKGVSWAQVADLGHKLSAQEPRQ